MSTNMMLSPMQQEHLTKEEFREFRDEVNNRFDTQDEYIRDGFDKSFEFSGNVEKKVDDLKISMNRRFDEVNSKFGEVNNKFDEQNEYMDGGFVGLGKQIDAVESNLNKKIDLMAGDLSWLKRSVGKLMKKAGVQ